MKKPNQPFSEPVRTTKEAWWDGARVGAGLPPDTPRTEVAKAFPRKPGRPASHPHEGGAQKKYTVNLTPAQVARALQYGPTVSAGINAILRSLNK